MAASTLAHSRKNETATAIHLLPRWPCMVAATAACGM